MRPEHENQPKPPATNQEQPIALSAPPGSGALYNYLLRLVELQRLIDRGEGDGETAEQVRGGMDSPWYKMTPDEIRLVGDISEMIGRDNLPNAKEWHGPETSE